MSFERYEEGDDESQFPKSILGGCLIICSYMAILAVGILVLIQMFY